MRPEKRQSRRAAEPARRKPRKSPSGLTRLAPAWALLARLRHAGLRVPMGIARGLGACLPPMRDRSFYNLIAEFRPQTRKCLLGVLAAAVVALSAWLFIFSPQGLVSRTRLDAMLVESAETNAGLARRNIALQDEITRLENDPETIEAMARNELNMAFPNESIYRPREEGPPAYVLNVTPMNETIQ